MINIHLRFYEELNDFLPLEKQKIRFDHSVATKTSIKDIVEALGVPHTEIDLILVNGKSVDFTYQIKNNDDISIYPVFEKLDISEINHLRPEPLRNPKFILDVHLGKLARHMRLLGFDTIYDNSYADKTIALHSQNENRIVLTRDIGLLKNKIISRGYWIRQTDPEKQIREILDTFDLYRKCQPFTRCIECNGLLEEIEKKEIDRFIPPLAKKYYAHFMQCHSCKRIYWEGTHYQKLKAWVDKIMI